MRQFGDNKGIVAGRPKNFAVFALVLWGAAAIILLSFVWYESGLEDSFERFYLLPWCLVAAVVILAPSIYLFYKGKFDPFHPLVFAVWSYIFPAFVLGGLILSFGLSDPYYLVFVEDPEYNLPLSLGYVMIGYLSLTAGYFLPLGKFLAGKLEPSLPDWKWETDEIWLPGILLMLAGFGVNILGFIQGLFGFQRVDEIGMFDGLLFFLVLILSEGNVLLWLGIFKTQKKYGIFYLVLVILIAVVPLRMAIQGNRGTLLSSVIPIALAFQYSGRRLRFKHTAMLGLVIVLAVFIGMIYGTAFRNIKGSEARTNAGEYVEQVVLTVDYLTTRDPGKIIYESSLHLAERIDNLSALGVAVANYEKLAPYESSFGIDNNILRDLYTSFIPRFIWEDKPPTSDARAYSDLYFNYSQNSFAVTPFGDLLRNFGPFGVPLGMMLLGIYLRWIYTQLIQTPEPRMWKKVAYYALLIVVSYEGFYATIFPSIIRTVFVLGFSLFFVNTLIEQMRLFNKSRNGF